MPLTSLVKPNRPSFESLSDLAARVEDGDRIAIGGHHFARLPIALLRQVATARKDLKYASWAGGLALEMLLEAGAVAEIEICFSSLDIFGLPPRFRRVAESRAMPVRDRTALALNQALRARQQNLPFMPFQPPDGSDMMARMAQAHGMTDPVSGREVAIAEPLELDCVVIHAPRADVDGNVQIIGAVALDFALVGAARKVLVTVEEIVPRGQLAAAGRQTILTRNQITAIAEVPGGAYPTSCLPFYVNDWARLKDIVLAPEGRLLGDLALPDDGVPTWLRRAATIPAGSITPTAAPAIHNRDAVEATVDEVMAIRLAMTLDNDSFASAGAVSPLANVAYRLAKRTHAPEMIIATLTCGHVDVQPGTMSLSLVESMDQQTAVAHCGGDDTYSTYYQAGAVTHEIVAAAQIDAQARVNNIEIAKPNGGVIRLPGQGGMADVANLHRDYVLYVTRHSPRSLVEQVDAASCGRGVLSARARQSAGLRPGQVMLITNLAVFSMNENTGRLAVVETIGAATREEISAQTGFPVEFADDCRRLPPPDRDYLEILRRDVDPLGLRGVEFVSAKDRTALLDNVIAADRAFVDRLLASPD